MTQIPEHLLRRAEEARKTAENQVSEAIQRERWGFTPPLARAVIYLKNLTDELAVPRQMPEDVVDCVAAARDYLQGEEERRKRAVHRLIAEYEAEYGEITPEEIADIRRSMY